MNKIEALEATVENLNSKGHIYNWMKIESCNCGQVAQVVMELKGEKLFNSFISPLSYHSMLSNHKHCSVTGKPMCEVISKLLEVGFTYTELKHLELFSDIKILERRNIKTKGIHHDKKKNLILYIEAWIELLKEQEPKEIEEKTVYVVIDKEVRAEIKENVKKESVLN